MGKTKVVKKPTAPLKISTSLFRRKSKNSSGQVDKEASLPASKPGKGKVIKNKSGSPKGKVGNKEGSKQSSSTASSASSSPTSSSSSGAVTKQQKKTAAIATTTGKKGSEGKLTQGKNKKGVTPNTTTKKATGKAASVKGKPSKTSEKSKKASAITKDSEKSPGLRKDKSPSPRPKGRSSSNSNSSSSSSSIVEKIATRKRSKSDAESPPSPVQKKMAKNEEGESTTKAKSTTSKKGVKTTTAKTNSTTTSVGKKVTKKATASIVASKKKQLPVKLQKASAKTKGSTISKQPDKPKTKGGQKTNANKAKSSNSKGTKSKVKPRPKIKLKRMASLNAKAILEASFSFEPQEKKQRSPAPSSTSIISKVKNMDDVATAAGKDGSSNGKPITGSSSTSTGTQKGNHDVMMSKFISTATSTSPPPPPIPSAGKVGAERKRKSSETPNRRESTTSNKSASSKGQSNVANHLITTSSSSNTSSKAGSRRNSTAAGGSSPAAVLDSSSTGTTKMSKKSKKDGLNPKKKTKVSTATTSTSTSTSPLPSSEFYPEQLRKSKHKHKHRKSVGVDSGTNTSSGDRNQDSGIQVEHEILQSTSNIKQKSAGCQAKEKKSSSTPVAHFGTVYQPAGPLIEPHKNSSSVVPAGILPETVKLPPDLKVTYQTHPPTSSAPTVSHSSSSKASKKHSSSSSASISTSSHQHKSEKVGQILHQPYKSVSSSSTGSPSMSRQIQPNYPGVSYVSAATGSPLLSSHSSMVSQQQSGSVVQQQQHHQLAGLTMTGHHGLSSTGAISVGPSHQPQPSASAGAPSAGGLFYSQSSGFAPHHSPFAPCKYPMVPPDSYRTHSPYPNSFLYPQTTPQQSQNYFMTPFYTPPLTPNSTPGAIVSGLGGQSRPLPLTAHLHPSAAAASFYQPHNSPIPPSAHLHPSNYLVASPHHSIQPAPSAPGHAGLFHPNQSTQPACPCPTESCQLSNTNSNKPQQQQQCVSSVSLLAPEAGAKQPKLQSQQALVSTNATRPGRNFINEVQQHRPTCITPAVAADPPVTIKLLNSNVDVQQSQARQLESAKTFTEQYSLPDDITITPIIVSSANTNALLLMGPSISIISTSAPSSSVNSSSTNSSSRILNCNSSPKKKEKDIVHVIDPRSGQRTTIAKHISNKNLLANNTNKNSRSTSANKNSGQIAATAVSRLKPNINKLGAVSVGKLNPDLDVIVINNSGSSSGDHISENGKLRQEQTKAKRASQLTMNNSTVKNKKSNNIVPKVNLAISKKSGNKVMSQSVARRVALADNDNNSPRKIAPKKSASEKPSEKPSVPFQSTNSSFNYSLPPGISISAGIGTNLSITSSTLNNITSMQNQSLNLSVKPMTVQNFQKSDFQNHKLQPLQSGSKDPKSKKRISLNDCIDGLQKKRLKLLESPHGYTNGTSDLMNGNIILPSTNGRAKSVVVFPLKQGLSHTEGNVMVKDTFSSARVRDPELNLGSTVINSSDAVVAVSAVFLNPESYHLSRTSRAAATTKGLNKNGLKKGKFQQNRGHFITTPITMSGKRSSTKMKVKPLEKVLTTRNTRSAAANAKIRTRLSAKPKLGGSHPGDPNQGGSRSRSRLLRKRNQFISPNNRKSESDCSSTCTSRSNSVVRIVGGSGPNGRLEKERVSKYPSQAFINAVADLYQYRRNVMLRVPKSGVGIFPSASSVNLLNLPGNSTSDQIKGVLSPDQEKQKMQLFPSGQHVFLEYKSAFSGSSRSSSPVFSGFSGPGNNKLPLGSMAANAAKKRAMVKPLSPALVNGALLQMGMVRRQPKWSNGWRFEGEPYESKVLVNNDDQAVLRRCYPAMRHESGDVIQTRDCVLLKSGSRKNDLPYIAKIAALWENPGDGEMMFSLLWYYRPEHVEQGRTREDMPDEIFASKHIDVNSVATIDDRCYVLTYNEYCRYRKQLKQLEKGLPNKPLISLMGASMVNNNAAGNIAGAVWSGRSTEPNRAPSPGKISPEVVFFCRKVYDFRQKRIMKNPS